MRESRKIVIIATKALPQEVRRHAPGWMPSSRLLSTGSTRALASYQVQRHVGDLLDERVLRLDRAAACEPPCEIATR